MKNRTALIVAVLLAAIATLGVAFTLNEIKSKTETALTMDKVLYAAVNIERGQVLIEGMYTIREIPQLYISNDHIKDDKKEDYVNQKIHARVNSNAPIMINYFQTELVDVTESKPQIGYRAISFPVDATQGVAGLLRPQQHVDVLATIESRSMPGLASWDEVSGALGGNALPEKTGGLSPEEYATEMSRFHAWLNSQGQEGDGQGQTGGASTFTLLQNVTLLAVDSFTESGQPGYESVTLEVTPEQAQILLFAKENAKLHLALRNKHDTHPSRLAPVYLERLLDPRGLGGPKTVESASRATEGGSRRNP